MRARGDEMRKRKRKRERKRRYYETNHPWYVYEKEWPIYERVREREKERKRGEMKTWAREWWKSYERKRPIYPENYYDPYPREETMRDEKTRETLWKRTIIIHIHPCSYCPYYYETSRGCERSIITQVQVQQSRLYVHLSILSMSIHYCCSVVRPSVRCPRPSVHNNNTIICCHFNNNAVAHIASHINTTVCIPFGTRLYTTQPSQLTVVVIVSLATNIANKPCWLIIQSTLRH